jgi:hypothetical protein
MLRSDEMWEVYTDQGTFCLKQPNKAYADYVNRLRLSAPRDLTESPRRLDQETDVDEDGASSSSSSSSSSAPVAMAPTAGRRKRVALSTNSAGSRAARHGVPAPRSGNTRGAGSHDGLVQKAMLANNTMSSAPGGYGGYTSDSHGGQFESRSVAGIHNEEESDDELDNAHMGDTDNGDDGRDQDYRGAGARKAAGRPRAPARAAISRRGVVHNDADLQAATQLLAVATDRRHQRL